MIRFLIDEDIPRSTAKVLKRAGFECFDVRDIGLKGVEDDVIYAWAQKEDCIILTGDLGFSNTLRFPVGTHKGIVVARFPNEMSTGTINKLLETVIVSTRNDLSSNLTIIEPGKVRIRRKKG